MIEKEAAEELKPCPQCGRHGEVEGEFDYVVKFCDIRDRFVARAWCNVDHTCGLSIEVEGDTRDEAMVELRETWNDRPVEDALRAEIAELKEESERLLEALRMVWKMRPAP